MKNINEQNREHILNGKKAVVKYGHQFCNPCKIYEQMLNTLPPELELYSCDTMENVEWASSLGLRAVPTTILFDNGQEVSRLVGVQSKETVLKLFE
jgi:thioredoxin 1